MNDVLKNQNSKKEERNKKEDEKNLRV